MTPRAAPQPRTYVADVTVWQRARCGRSTALAAVWTSTALMSLLAPDLLPGAGDHPVPLAAMTAWVWAAAATGFLRLLPSSRLSHETVAVVVTAWGAALLLSVTAPELVVQGGLVRIPITACVALALATLATGYAAVAAVVRSRSVADRGR